MTIKTSTLRPGLLVSLKSSVSGNVQYSRRDIENAHRTKDGIEKAKWETERTITDPKEHEAAILARNSARLQITRICAQSAFGLLCPELAEADLEKAIADARDITEAFNAKAKLTRVSINVLTGRIAPDDVEAVKAINSEVRDLLSAMERGIKNLDVKQVREAASKARGIGTMLTNEAKAQIQIAIEAARSCATRIVKAGDQAALEIDQATLVALKEARTSFLDLEDAQPMTKPKSAGRTIDLAPVISATKKPRASARQIEVE
jgi:hypothetical protein